MKTGLAGRGRRTKSRWAGVAVLTLALAWGAKGLAADAAPATAEPPADFAPALAACRPAAERLTQAALGDTNAFFRLACLCDRFGPRFSGSTNLEAAIDWILGQMRQDGLENVQGEPVWVPHWVRGAESLELTSPRAQPLRLLGLGGSVSTPAAGIEGEVLVVTNFADLRARALEARGRIVLFNQPFTSYGQTLAIRSRGAIEASKAGAVASLIRSVTPFSIQSPHTGMMRYEEGVPRIPHAAVTVETAAMLQRMQDRGERIVVRLTMGAATLPDAPSRNVLAELRGREKPEEIVLVSGHVDSWDVGQGATDDAGGCLAAWEAVRLMKRLDLRPRRTVRVVLWANEENGLRGSRTYATNHLEELGRHVLGIESDLGVFRPTGFAFKGTPAALAQMQAMGRLLEPVGASAVVRDAGEGSADLMALGQAGVPIMELTVDGSRYFWFHHTEADTVDKLDRGEFNRCVAALAAMAYVAAESPGRLPR